MSFVLLLKPLHWHCVTTVPASFNINGVTPMPMCNCKPHCFVGKVFGFMIFLRCKHLPNRKHKDTSFLFNKYGKWRNFHENIHEFISLPHHTTPHCITHCIHIRWWWWDATHNTISMCYYQRQIKFWSMAKVGNLICLPFAKHLIWQTLQFVDSLSFKLLR